MILLKYVLLIYYSNIRIAFRKIKIIFGLKIFLTTLVVTQMCKVASRMLSFPLLNLVILYEITILLKVDTKLTHFKRGHLCSLASSQLTHLL